MFTAVVLASAFAVSPAGGLKVRDETKLLRIPEKANGVYVLPERVSVRLWADDKFINAQEVDACLVKGRDDKYRFWINTGAKGLSGIVKKGSEVTDAYGVVWVLVEPGQGGNPLIVRVEKKPKP